ncbi:toll/interleukin-1 receptor domain-containing protein [Massilioclostridium coli]|uniref:toll/interleukin-1 receptor domain-containing protein n=1 Tax=Massilioclostridium coli TaxID=1870991 RepID=UPI0022E4FD5A|nr:toll/interleukin-1 receptor domain-containing protein [Massilioclostridium coli]
MVSYLEYGPVICLEGSFKGQIGYLDDFDEDNDKILGIVYFGNPLLCSSYFLIPVNYLSNSITMHDIIQCKEKLASRISRQKDNKNKSQLLLELEFVNTLFYERHITTHTLSKSGLKLFISHSSQDKGYANLLYADLKDAGCIPWLDQWDILGGQSIPTEIEKGIDNSDFLLILLSKNSVTSSWVRAEWESSIWDENQDKQVRVIPILIEECTIPRFLKTKKYIDFRQDYGSAFRELLYTIDKLK